MSERFHARDFVEFDHVASESFTTNGPDFFFLLFYIGIPVFFFPSSSFPLQRNRTKL